jgi:hypothetical protein
MLIPALLLAAAPGCNDSAVESDGPEYCMDSDFFEWWTECEEPKDCCLGSEPRCQEVPALGSGKYCTRECTTAPEDEPIEGQCCITSQEHGCDTGCCMVNYIEPDGGTENAGWGIGVCTPDEM